MSESSIPDVIGETMLTEAVKETIKGLFKKMRNYLKAKAPSSEQVEHNDPKFDKLITALLIEMYNWSSHIEFIGLSDPVDLSTIELEYYFSYRDEAPIAVAEESNLSEKEILLENKNIIIEGPPGSGKTTTLKRLLSRNFFSGEVPGIFDYPLVVRLRLIEDKSNLFSYICQLLGIETQIKTQESVNKVKKTRRKDFLNKSKDIELVEYTVEEKIVTHFEAVGDVPVQRFVIELLEENKVLLLIDGLDELSPGLLDEFKRNINELISKTSQAKLILTTRHDYIALPNTNCLKVRIKDLNVKQQHVIASLWTKRPDLFLEELASKSYSELATKPLFLTFLILLFNENISLGSPGLPIDSIDVYSQVIELIIDKWDRKREIRSRQSKYSNFHNKKKEKFLSELAFYLTYQVKQKAFTTRDLEIAYQNIYDNFNLPIDEGELVVGEVQSHTGLIIKTAYNKYEFSHLALQEFLCAKYIIKTTSHENVILYLFEYPQPLALCVGLSGDSSLWLESWLLSKLVKLENGKRKTEVASQLLGRLIIEKPYFKFNLKLAAGLLTLSSQLDFMHSDAKKNYHEFIRINPNVDAAIREVLKSYQRKTDHLEFWGKRAYKLTKNHDSCYPKTIMLADDSFLTDYISQ